MRRECPRYGLRRKIEMRGRGTGPKKGVQGEGRVGDGGVQRGVGKAFAETQSILGKIDYGIVQK